MKYYKSCSNIKTGRSEKMYFKFQIKKNFEHISASKERETIGNLEDALHRKAALHLIDYAIDELADRDNLALISALEDIHDNVTSLDDEALNRISSIGLGDYTLFIEEVTEDDFNEWLTSDEPNWLQELLDERGMTRYTLSKLTGIQQSQLASIVNSNIKKDNVKYGQVVAIEKVLLGDSEREKLRNMAYTIETLERELDAACLYGADERCDELHHDLREETDEFVRACTKYFLKESDYYELHLDELHYDKLYSGIVDDEE